ncbi:MAG: tetratricopeptide (TPR) repeat protein [Bradymonadia bacterium]
MSPFLALSAWWARSPLLALSSLLLALPAHATGPLRIIDAIDSTRCEPVGVLAKMLEVRACALDFNACSTAPATVRGDRDDAALYLSLIARDSGRWQAACPGDGPKYLHQMGIEALGYRGKADHLDALLALLPDLAQLGENSRRLLAAALYRIGDPRAAPAMAQMLELDAAWPDFKAIAVAGLARWVDASGIAWCSQNLGASARSDLAANCADYLARVQAPDAVKLLSRALAHHPEPALRALGTLGDKAAGPAVRRFAAKAQRTSTRVAAWVTLVQLGDDKYLNRITKALRAPSKLRKQRLEKSRKRAKRKKRRRSRRRRRSRKKTRRAPSRRARKQLMKMLNSLELAHHIAMEITRVDRDDIRARLDRALWSAARSEFTYRWKAHTYALLALAQRGDTKAIDRVLAELPDATEAIRRAIVATAGGRGWNAAAPTAEFGAGLIADPRVQAAMLALADNCDTHAQRVAALNAALLIRAAGA